MNDINMRVKELRTKLQLSQEDFGNKIGLTKSSISNIENGTRNVTTRHIKLICTNFNVNESWLVTGIDNTEKLSSLEKLYIKFESLIKYLESLGYFISIEKSGETKNGYYENIKASDNHIIGNSFIPNDEYFSIIISKGKTKTLYTDKEFELLQKNIEQIISFELFKHSSK